MVLNQAPLQRPETGRSDSWFTTQENVVCAWSGYDMYDASSSFGKKCQQVLSCKHACLQYLNCDPVHAPGGQAASILPF